MINTDDIIVAVDLGNSKIAAMAARKTSEGKLRILGIEQEKTPVDAIRNGIVRKPSSVSQKLAELIRKLENRINQKVHIRSFYISINGYSLRTIHVKNVLSFAGVEEITEQHLKMLENDLIQKLAENNFFNEEFFQKEKSNPDLSETSEKNLIYDIMPQTFFVDEEIVENPIGETGRQIGARYLLTVGKYYLFKNIDDSIQRTGFEAIKPSVLQVMGQVFLSPEEKQLGCALIDFGANCTTLSVFCRGTLQMFFVIPFGGHNITKDICDLQLLESEAETLKRHYANAIVDSEENNRSVEIPSIVAGMNNRIVRLKELAGIVAARQEEIVDMLWQKIEKEKLTKYIGAGIVITGGASQLKNLPVLLQKKTGLQVRNLVLADFLDENSKQYAQPEYALLEALLLNGDEACCDKNSNTAPIPASTKKRNILKYGANGIKNFVTKKIPDLFAEDETPLN